MKRKVHSQESILEAIRGAAKKLGYPPSVSELKAATGVSREIVLRRFESVAAAVRAAGFEPRRAIVRIAEPVLLEAWGGLVRELGRVPRRSEYIRLGGKFSPTLYYERFGTWAAIPREFLKWFAEIPEWSDVVEAVRKFLSSPEAELRAGSSSGSASPATSRKPRSKKLNDRPTFGGPMDFPGMRYEPSNENGVVFLFGAVARGLGFVVEMIQSGFPDCLAAREIAPGKWQRVRIEFEFQSRNFRDGGHATDGCDLIVCWRHNWPGCLLEVIELASVIQTLPLCP